MNIDIEQHRQWFEGYVGGKISQCAKDAAPLRLKFEHSLQALENAKKIAERENFSPDIRDACLLAALYHDLARFDQYLLYDTFKDRDSRDHGYFGVKILKEQKRLAGLPAEVKHAVMLAVGQHNKFALPARLTDSQNIICRLTRDADKLDILRIMHGHLAQKPYNPTVVLTLPDDDSYSAPVIDAVLNGKIGSYSDLSSVNDLRLLLGSWFFDLNFKSSKQIFFKSGHALSLIEPLENNPRYQTAYRYLMSRYAAAN